MAKDATIATTIISQLGGNKFMVCTGSKIVNYTDNSITFKLARNKSSANELTITLNGLDLYDITFARHSLPHLNKSNWSWVADKYKIVKTYQDIFCEQLQELFTEFTGLVTRLF